MITDEVINKFNENGGCPPHILSLKVNDICILLRQVDNEIGLTSNTSVRIISINNANRIIIQTLDLYAYVEVQTVYYYNIIFV